MVAISLCMRFDLYVCMNVYIHIPYMSLSNLEINNQTETETLTHSSFLYVLSNISLHITIIQLCCVESNKQSIDRTNWNATNR